MRLKNEETDNQDLQIANMKDKICFLKSCLFYEKKTDFDF